MKRRFLPLLLALLPCSAGAVAAQGQGQQVQLPEGDGRDLVQATCARCHSLANIRNAGYSAQGWRALFSSMVTLPDAEATRVAQYLAAHFPENPARRPVLVPGNTRVAFREWLVPTLGSRPHDPA